MTSYLCFSRRELHKCSTQPQLLLETQPKLSTTSTIHSSSSSSIDSDQQEYTKTAIKWILDFQRKLTKDSNHLAVWYLELAIKAGLNLKQSNWQLIAATMILIATKMNQIYPPSISSIVKRCSLIYLKNYPINRNQILSMEQNILKLLNFNIAQQSPYSLIVQKLQSKVKQVQQCQKLLKILYPFKDICQNTSQELSNSIIYLISRSSSYISKMSSTQIKQTKTLADKIYLLYKKVKGLHVQKKNRQSNQLESSKSIKSIKSIQQWKQNLTSNNNLLTVSASDIKNQNTLGFYSKQSTRFSYKNLYMYA